MTGIGSFSKYLLLTISGCIALSALQLRIPDTVRETPATITNPPAGSADQRDLRENCRLLGIIGRPYADPLYLEDSLIEFGKPSYPQHNGWSLSLFSDITQGGYLAVPGKPMIIRSPISSTQDFNLFETTASLVIRLRPTIVIGHLRNASSGCTVVGDPHPFEWEYEGRTFLMIHNGGVWGKDLDYIRENLISGRTIPSSCPETPIDSEYLFIYLMELIEEMDGDIWGALHEWATTLISALEDDWNALNILLTDGEILWGVRISYHPDRFLLHYQIPQDYSGGAISTEALGLGWTRLFNYSLIEMRAGYPALIERLPHPIVDNQILPHKLKLPFALSYHKQ